MRELRGPLIAAAVFFAVIAVAVGWLTAEPQIRPAGVPHIDHFFTIVMENQSYAEVIGNPQAPYINSLAKQYGLAAGYAAVSHPSLPNYLALTGGDTFGITDDCTDCFVKAPNIVVDRVERSGRSWKAYMEDMPSPCFLGDSGKYVQKHNPFLYYDSIRLNHQECRNVVPYKQLATDLATAAATPSYVWISPNVINDMHDGTVAQGDAWLQENVPAILSSPAWTSQTSLLFIVWDEDDGGQNNQVANLVISQVTPAGYASKTPYTHYSLLRTIEVAWGLAPLTTNDVGAPLMTEFFNGGRTVASDARSGGT